MIKTVTPALLGLFCFSLAVTAQDVKYNFDQNADFSKYHTYKWEKHPKSLDVDELTMKQLGTGFDTALTAKGLRRVDSGPTDLVIVFQLAVNQEKEISSYSTGFGTGPGYRGGWYGGGSTMTTATTNTIAIGTVVLDMYDTAAKNLVWRGMASKTIDAKAKPDKRQKNINKAAQKMLKNYPPKKK